MLGPTVVRLRFEARHLAEVEFAACVGAILTTFRRSGREPSGKWRRRAGGQPPHLVELDRDGDIAPSRNASGVKFRASTTSSP